MWCWDTKWVCALGTMVLVDLLDAGLLQTFNLLKKKKRKSNIFEAQWNKVCLSVSVYVCVWVCVCVWASQVALVVKNLPATVRDTDLIPGSERSPGGQHGNPTPVFWPGESWQATVHRVSKTQTRLKQLGTHVCICPCVCTGVYICLFVCMCLCVPGVCEIQSPCWYAEDSPQLPD